ncbi:hypothetical protein [Microbacterium sp. NPDC090003]|uniref:hypothetical protein n=1 Tax=Microbacterium sp. NPDC090003 TaxID=3364203 RepID=UPI0038021AC1
MTASPDYAYLGRWNYSLQEPVPDESWIPEAEAKADYDSCTVAFDIVDGDVNRFREETRLIPPWVITSFGGVLSGFRVNHLTAQGSVRLDIHFEHVQGRLFLGTLLDYTYPDDDRYYRRSDSTQILYGIMNPDGTGFLTIDDKSRPTVERLSMDQVDVSNNWLDRPGFGDWHVLLGPDAGTRLTSPSPAAAPTARRSLVSRLLRRA